jgi:UDP-2,3-diacylglucosamine pyrophosphatase LpxH
MDEYTIISDLHLGSSVSQSEKILEFLYYLDTKTLVLNGDIFDCGNINRLNKKHWNIVKKLRQMSKTTEIIWISGNHDFKCENIAHLLGAEFKANYFIKSRSKKIYLTHGDKFDKIISTRPLLTKFADNVYRIIQTFDKYRDNDYYYSRLVKMKSKTLTKSTKDTIKNCIEYCLKHNYNSIIIGHTHRAEYLTFFEYGLEYVNSGCWTDKKCHYVSINNGNINLKVFQPEKEKISVY